MKCECCEKDMPRNLMFKYKHNKITYDLCHICYANVETLFFENINKTSLILTNQEVKELQNRNENFNNTIKNLDFKIFPRNFLEELLNHIKEQDFTRFKKLLLDFQEKSQTKIINIP